MLIAELASISVKFVAVLEWFVVFTWFLLLVGVFFMHAILLFTCIERGGSRGSLVLRKVRTVIDGSLDSLMFLLENKKVSHCRAKRMIACPPRSGASKFFLANPGKLRFSQPSIRIGKVYIFMRVRPFPSVLPIRPVFVTEWYICLRTLVHSHPSRTNSTAIFSITFCQRYQDGTRHSNSI